MFNIDRNPSFWADVDVTLPGGPSEAFRAKFAVQATSTLAKVDFGQAEGMAAFLRSALQDIDDVVNEGGDGVLLAEAIDWLIDLPHVRNALFRAYTTGLAAAASGN